MIDWTGRLIWATMGACQAKKIAEANRYLSLRNRIAKRINKKLAGYGAVLEEAKRWPNSAIMNGEVFSRVAIKVAQQAEENYHD